MVKKVNYPLGSSISTLTVTTAFFFFLLHLFVMPTTSLLPPDDFPPHLSSSSTSSSSSSQGGPMADDKMRLGSRPPSCHNKCNLCHPCMAVQAPTMPASKTDEASRGSYSAVEEGLWSFDGGSAGSDRYSNYKPLGWKCRCRNRIYDP